MNLIEVLEKAIEAEVEAQNVYSNAAKEAQDPELKALFEQLAKAEKEHERILRDKLLVAKLMKEQLS